ncbi:MAG: hypothetical protein K0R57_3202 [Paenibacillaceae bacterium]|jgi:hypothetical protein|nr:hypothetical protein [Paenibacillaceae bacterium]
MGKNKNKKMDQSNVEFADELSVKKTNNSNKANDKACK